MKLEDLKPGDTIVLDGGFTCAPAGSTVVEEDASGLFFRCKGPEHEGVFAHPTGDGHHYLDGQEDEDGELSGISAPVDR